MNFKNLSKIKCYNCFIDNKRSEIMEKILIIEDDKNLNRGLSIALKESYDVESVFTVADAKNFLNEVHLILLDLNLPDGDGLEFIRYMRTFSSTPIIVLSAIDFETHIISAINFGADDYMTKPFSLGILQAKIARLIEKNKTFDEKVYSKKSLYFDFSKNIFMKDNKKIEFTPIERSLIYYLTINENIIIAKEILVEKIWDSDFNFVDENTLSVNISRIRSKLKPLNPIETIFGVGYKWKF